MISQVMCSEKDFHLNVCYWSISLFFSFSSGIGKYSHYCAVFLLYCWLPGHKPIWNQFLISLAESSPDSISGVIYKGGHFSWGGMPSKPRGCLPGSCTTKICQFPQFRLSKGWLHLMRNKAFGKRSLPVWFFPLHMQRSGQSAAALCSALCTVQACHRKGGQKRVLHILLALSSGADINGPLMPHRPLCHLQKCSFLFPATLVWLHWRALA